MRPATNKIRAFREQKGWNQTELARRLDVTPEHVSQIERGVKEPSPRLARRIAQTLGVLVDALELGLEQSARPSVNMVPITGFVCAGDSDEMIVCTEDLLGWESCDLEQPERCVAYEVAAEGMDPLFCKGDHLVFLRGETPQEGDLVEAEFRPLDKRGEPIMTLKILHLHEGIQLLEPINSRRYRTVVADLSWSVKGILIRHVRRNLRGWHEHSLAFGSSRAEPGAKRPEEGSRP